MEKSVVGDRVLWPGLVYAPLNRAGLLYALGAITGSLGLLFEEFSEDGSTAVCRRKTRVGWERVGVAFAFKSSEYRGPETDIDLLICWQDDATDVLPIRRLALSELVQSSAIAEVKPTGEALEGVLPDGAIEDLLQRGQRGEEYEETVRKLDEQIKKLRRE